MKKFVFELQTLHDMKKQEEDFEKIQLGKIEERLKELSMKLERLDFEHNNTKSAFSKEVNQATRAPNLSQYDNYLKKIAQQAALQKEKIKKENEEKSENIKRLIEIQKELKSLEKLKEKKYEEYQKDEKREEEKLIDDIVSFKIATS